MIFKKECVEFMPAKISIGNQIFEYDTDLLDHGIPREGIHHYGLAFRGKQILIGE